MSSFVDGTVPEVEVHRQAAFMGLPTSTFGSTLIRSCRPMHWSPIQKFKKGRGRNLPASPHHAPRRYATKPLPCRYCPRRHHASGGHLSSHVGGGETRPIDRSPPSVDGHGAGLGGSARDVRSFVGRRPRAGA